MVCEDSLSYSAYAVVNIRYMPAGSSRAMSIPFIPPISMSRNTISGLEDFTFSSPVIGSVYDVTSRSPQRLQNCSIILKLR